MSSRFPHLENPACTRRDFLRRSGMGMAGLGLGGLLTGQGIALGDAPQGPMAARAPHFPAKAKHVIHFFLNGGPSHVDTFDPKPALQKYAGQMLPVENLATERKTGAALPSPFKFKRYGQSGLEISELFPHVAESADELVVIRSMQAKVPNHEPSLLLMNCGAERLARPSLGSWLTYGLGTENQNLPGFFSMCPSGVPTSSNRNWQSAFLPGAFQGTYVETKHREVEKLIEHVKNYHATPRAQQAQLDLLSFLNRRHAEARQNDAELESRIHSFELAARMQIEASEAFDLRHEPQAILDLYGDTDHGRQALFARRLVERGVRFVQLWHGASQPWDSHDDLELNHRRLAKEADQAIGALLKDLKQCGLLDETLVVCGGEFGRTPVVELPAPGTNEGKFNGRDHNHHGFSLWMAGGGVKRGMTYGATDEFGFRAVENPVHVHDLHATILHLMGFDHEQLTYQYAGRNFRLTDVAGRVVHDILA